MMSDNGKKTLSLKAKTQQSADEEPVVRRSKKRIIRRSDIPTNKLSGSRKAAKQPFKKGKPAPQKPSKPLSPGDQKAMELTALLIERFPVWADSKPLALGISDALLGYLQQENIEASKRVIHRVLWHHTHKIEYLESVLSASHRYGLDGNQQQEIKDSERAHAARVLEQQKATQKKR